MKLALFLLATAVMGLAVQNYRLSVMVEKIDHHLRRQASSAPVITTWDSSPVADQGSDKLQRNLDSLSNALSDRGITWYPD